MDDCFDNMSLQKLPKGLKTFERNVAADMAKTSQLKLSPSNKTITKTIQSMLEFKASQQPE